MSEPCRKPVTVACPNCGAEVAWDSRNRHRPFCSERCKLMDLGQWAAERYRVAGEATNQEPADTQSGKD
jgi:uncharacterized protein